MTYFNILYTPFINLLVCANEKGAITQILFVKDINTFEIDREWVHSPERLKEAILQLKAYFKGERKVFNLELAPIGTPFQKSVWNSLLKIPFGEVKSYQDIAEGLDKPGASRAVGLANSLNPIPIIVPCHRVIGKNGKLTGYAGGMELKEQLLILEGVLPPKLNF